jgi:hypothetical protein
MLFPLDLQDLITVALVIDAFIFGAMWQFMSNPNRKRAAIRKRAEEKKGSLYS